MSEKPRNWVITTSVGLRRHEKRALEELARRQGLSRSKLVARLVMQEKARQEGRADE